MEITVKITQILQARGFTKRDGSEMTCYAFVGEFQNGQYKNNLKFDVWDKEKWEKWLGEGFKVGANCKIMFDLKSNEVNGKWFTNATCCGVQILNDEAQAATTQQDATRPQPQPEPQTASNASSGSDDLPF